MIMTKNCQRIREFKHQALDAIYMLNLLDRQKVYSLYSVSKRVGYPIVPAEEEGCVHKYVKN